MQGLDRVEKAGRINYFEAAPGNLLTLCSKSVLMGIVAPVRGSVSIAVLPRALYG